MGLHRTVVYSAIATLYRRMGPFPANVLLTELSFLVATAGTVAIEVSASLSAGDGETADNFLAGLSLFSGDRISTSVRPSCLVEILAGSSFDYRVPVSHIIVPASQYVIWRLDVLSNVAGSIIVGGRYHRTKPKE